MIAVLVMDLTGCRLVAVGYRYTIWSVGTQQDALIVQTELNKFKHGSTFFVQI